MKNFRGHIVAADITEGTITIRVESLGGANGAVIGEEVKIVSVNPDLMQECIESFRQGKMEDRQPGE